MQPQAKIFFSYRHNLWHVIFLGDILSAWKNKDIAEAYCSGYNDALKELNEEILK